MDLAFPHSSPMIGHGTSTSAYHWLSVRLRAWTASCMMAKPGLHPFPFKQLFGCLTRLCIVNMTARPLDRISASLRRPHWQGPPYRPVGLKDARLLVAQDRSLACTLTRRRTPRPPSRPLANEPGRALLHLRRRAR
jgi:hypothetical protein